MRKKRMLAAATVFAMLAVFTVGASAAATHETSTTYVLGSTQYVEVTSTITGVDPGEQVTYLAYNTSKGETPYAEAGDSNIVYIDQELAETETVEFYYVADIDKIGTTLIKFGAERTEDIQPVAGKNTINTYGIEAVFNDEKGSVTFPENILPGSDCTFTITPNSGYEIASIERSDEVSVDLYEIIIPSDGGCYYTVENITENFTLTVNFKAASEPDVPTITKGTRFGTPKLNKTGDDTAQNNLTAFSTVKVPSDITDVEYGILFALKDDPTFNNGDGITDWSANIAGNYNDEKLTTTSGVIKFKALGKGYDGKYAVKIIDGGSGLLKMADVYYIRPYIVIGSDYVNLYTEAKGKGVIYGDTVTFAAEN